MTLHRLISILTLCVAFLLSTNLHAQINSIASGNWNNPGVWQGGQVPGPTDNVVINGHSITLNVAAEVNDLTLNNATLSGNNDMTINGHFIWNGGSISGTGVIWSYGSALLTGGQKSLSSKTIRLVGESLWNNGNILGLSAFLVVWAEGELTIDVPTNSTLNYQQNGSATSLHNYGQIIKTGGGNFTHGFNTFFYNFNTGNLSIEEGIWSAGWHTELYNTIQLSENTELRNSNAMWLRGVTISGEGYLVNTSTLYSTATLSQVDNLKLNSGSISNEINNVQETINVMQNFIWTGGSLNSQQGRLNVYGYAHLTTTNTKTISERQFYIYGSGLWDAGIINAGFTGNVFWIEGTFEIHAAQGVDLSFQGTSGQFRNNGNITKTGPGNVIFGFSIGTIHFSGSVLNIEQGNYTHSSYCSFSGNMNISENAKFRNAGTAGAGTAVDISGAVIQGEGWFEIESGNLRLTTSTSSIENLKFISGDIYNVNSSETCPLSILNKFTWLGGKIYHPGNITISGHTHITGSNTKEISTNGRNIRIESTALWDGGLLVINNSGCGIVITNTGAMEVAVPQNTTLTTQGSSFDGGHFINNGVLTKSGQGKLSFGFRSHYFGTAGSTTNIHDGETDFGWYVEFRSLTNIANNSILRTTGGTTKIWMNGCTFEGEGWFINQSEIRVSGTNAVNLDNLNLKSGSIANNNSNSENTTVNVNGEFLWEAGSIYHTGTITVKGHAHLTGSGNKEISTNGRNLRIEGTALWDQGLLLKTNGGCGIVVISTGVFEIAVPQNSTLTAQGGPWEGGHWFNYGTIRKTGLGTFTSGFRHHFINFGTLSGVGTYNFTWHLENQGFIEPGLSVGELNINWGSTSFPFGNNGGLNIELLDNSGPGTGHDRAIFSNNVALNGTLNVTELESMPNGSYTILTCNGGANCRTGTFSFTNLPDCYTVQYTGNSVILVKDDTDPPVITGCPDDVTLSTDTGECYATFNVSDPQASDNCNLVSFEDNMPPLNRFPVGFTAVTFVATDGGGQSSTCYFEVTVIDNETPSISNCPASFNVNVPQGECMATVNWPEPTATDNCALESLVSDTQNGQNHGVGSFVVTYTATDDKGLVSTCAITVNVIDNQAPIISSCPQNISISTDEGECTATVSWVEPSADDNCGIQSFSSNGNNGGTYTVSTSTVSYVATDIHGNQSTCTFTITVSDMEAPVITGCPDDVQIFTTPNQCSGLVFWTAPQASDNCNLASFVSNIDNNSILNTGSYQVIYTATDGGGFSSLCSFAVSVIDNEIPTINNCPDDLIIPAASNNCSATVSWTEPSATDNCGVESLVNDGNNGGEYPVGIHSVTYISLDIHGNQSTCSFNIIVVDQDAPVISGCPQDIEINTIKDLCNAVVSWAEPQASDNCNLASFVSNIENNAVLNEGTHVVIYTATDENGTTSTCSFSVTVIDNQAPIIFGCPQNIDISTDEGACDATVSWIEPSASDNCGLLSLTGNGNNGGTYPISITQVTYIATDINGNQSTCSFIITISDQEAPVISGCPQDFTVNTTQNQCSALVAWVNPEAIDNCLLASFESNILNNSTLSVGIYQVTYTATDGGGLTNTCVFNVTVSDNQAPDITNCPTNIVVPTDFGQCTALVTWTEPTASDNCGIQSFSGNGNNGGEYNIGMSFITYTALDIHGNQSTCSFSITVMDEFVIICPSDIQVCIDEGILSIPDANPSGGNYSGPGVIGQNFDPIVAGTGIKTILYELQIGECISNCTFTITVHDLPVLNCPGQVDICITEPEFEMMLVTPLGGTYTGSGVNNNRFNASTADLGNNTITYSYTDENNCEVSCTFTINVYPLTTYYADADNDGFGDPNDALEACDQPEGYVLNNLDNCPDDPLKTEPGVCGCGVGDTDTDGDGTPDCIDECPNDPMKTEPGICGCGVADSDTDGDGTPDCIDACPNDPNKTEPGICGCGVADTDTDGDGTPDCNDECPNDPLKTEPGICGCGVADIDTDGDGTPDCIDACPNDPLKTEPGICGCGVADIDTDEDGIPDCIDECPLDPALSVAPIWYADIDGDGYGDPNNWISACTQPEGYVINNHDCNDTDPDINPEAAEVCDGVDNNCNGVTDEGCERIGVLGNNVRISNGDLSPVMYDGTHLGSTPLNVPKSQVFTISNVGGDLLNLTGSPIIDIYGPDADWFTINQPAENTLMPGESTTFSIHFNSNTEGLYQAFISIDNDDPFNQPFEFAIAAAASPMRMIVRGNGVNILSGDDTPSPQDFTDFGVINFNTNRSRTFAVHNLGSQTLQLNGDPRVIISGPNAALFQVTTMPPATIAPSQNRQLQIRYNGTQIGTHIARVTIHSNDPGTTPYHFDIKGEVLPPNMQVRGNNQIVENGSNEPSSNNLTDFGFVSVGGSKTNSLYVHNLGPGLLNLNGIPRVSLSGANANEFSITSQPVSNITSGSSSLLRIRYQPTSQGVHNATVVIMNNDPEKQPYTFSIQGHTFNAFQYQPGNFVMTSDSKEEIRINCYPNPVMNFTTIAIHSGLEEIEAVLLDMQGKIIKQFMLYNGNNLMDMNDLHPGIYQLKCLNVKVEPLKVIKE